jgi:hypothetical protein
MVNYNLLDYYCRDCFQTLPHHQIVGPPASGAVFTAPGVSKGYSGHVTLNFRKPEHSLFDNPCLDLHRKRMDAAFWSGAVLTDPISGRVNPIYVEPHRVGQLFASGAPVVDCYGVLGACAAFSGYQHIFPVPVVSGQFTCKLCKEIGPPVMKV